MSENVEDKLESLGVSPERVESHFKILLNSRDCSDLRREMGKKNYSSDCEQFLLPIFRAICTRDSEHEQKIYEELGDMGINREFLRKYFFDMGTQPYVLLNVKYKEAVPVNIRASFINNVREFLLRKVKRYLEIE